MHIYEVCFVYYNKYYFFIIFFSVFLDAQLHAHVIRTSLCVKNKFSPRVNTKKSLLKSHLPHHYQYHHTSTYHNVFPLLRFVHYQMIQKVVQ